MSLAPGARLGVYEVVSLLGAGGMGEVYRARDTRLKRDVAVKTLLSDSVADPERLARFQREGELLAALNHPNIAAIYGFEEAGSTHAIVMELVEGPTLAERIAPRTLQRPRQRSYTVHPDGERFAMAPLAGNTATTPDKVVFVFNFFDELRRIAPAGR